MKYKSIYYKGTKFEKITEGEVPNIVWELSIARGCIDWDRCNQHTQPCGSCKECLRDAQEIINTLNEKGIILIETAPNPKS